MLTAGSVAHKMGYVHTGHTGETMARSRRFSSLLAFTVVFSMMSLIPAGASDRVPLSLNGFFDIAVDDTQGRLFFSQGGGSSTVVVTDVAGTLVTEIDGLHDAMGMTLSEDGTGLWAALPTSNAVARIDTATLMETDRFALPDGVCPGSVAETEGVLAVGHSCNTYGGSGAYGSVGVLDPATGAWNDLGSGPFYQPFVASSPGAPGLVVAGDLGLSPTTLYSIGIVDGVPDTVTSRWDTGGNLRDLAMRPDGGTVVQASGAPYQHNSYTVPFLDDATSYTSTSYPNAVAWSADGSIVVTGTDSGYDIDVRVHAAGSPAAFAEYELAPHTLRPRGVAATADGAIVFAVTGDVHGEDLGLHILPGIASVASTVEVVGTATATVGEPTTLTGRLSFADGTVAAGRPIEVTRSYADVVESLGSVITDSTGAFSIVDVPTVATTIDYTFTFAGAPPYEPSSGITMLSVGKRQTELTISAESTGGKGKNRNDRIVTATLGETYTNRTVTITATPEGGATEVIAHGTVDADGELSATHTLAATTTFVANFDGDAWYETATAEITVEKTKGGGKPKK